MKKPCDDCGAIDKAFCERVNTTIGHGRACVRITRWLARAEMAREIVEAIGQGKVMDSDWAWKMANRLEEYLKEKGVL